MMSARRACLALSLVSEPGDPRLIPLLQQREPTEIVAALQGFGPGRSSLPGAWVERAERLERLVKETVDRSKEAGLRWLARTDQGWPAQLADLDHLEPLNGATGAPLGLWLRGGGNLARLTDRAVAVVGARDATTYGSEVASDLAADIADAGFTVVSGAAYGIDACAHRGALAMNKPTIAVLAGGADVDYPRAHTALLSRIADQGLVVSEQAPGSTPLKGRFLSRNRLIAALTLGTVVVEAARRSGSLNTLNWADQLGRSTMAIPGPITSQASAGVHEAMRTGQAMLVTCGADIAEVVGGLGSASAAPARAVETLFDSITAPARRTLDAVPWSGARSVADIAGDLRVSVAEARRHLLDLESLGHVARIGEGWTLVRRADLA